MATGTDLEQFRVAARETVAKYKYDHPVGEAIARGALARANAEIVSNWTPAGTAIAGGAVSKGPDGVINDLNSTLEDTYKKYNADVLIDTVLGATTIDSYKGQPLSNLSPITTDPRVKPEMKTVVGERLREKLAESYVKDWLNSSTTSTDSLNEYIGKIPPVVNVDVDFQNKLRTGAEKKMKERFESLKSGLENGTVTTEEFVKVMDDTKNPNLKTMLKKYWETDEERKKAKKEEADNAKMNPAVTSFKTEFDRLTNTGDAIKMSELADMVKNSPGFNKLPGPVQVAVEKSLDNKAKRAELEKKLDKVQLNKAILKKEIAKAERNDARSKVWLRKLAFIAGGMAVGGLGAYLLSPGLFAALMSANGLPGIGAALVAAGQHTTSNILGTTFAVTAGAAGGLSIYKYFDKQQVKLRSSLEDNEENLIKKELDIEKIKDGYVKKVTDSQKTFTTIAAKLAAMTEGLDKDQMVKAYLKRVSLSDIDEFVETK